MQLRAMEGERGSMQEGRKGQVYIPPRFFLGLLTLQLTLRQQSQHPLAVE